MVINISTDSQADFNQKHIFIGIMFVELSCSKVIFCIDIDHRGIITPNYGIDTE